MMFFSLCDIDNIRWLTVKTFSHSSAIIELEWLRYVYTSYQLCFKIFLFQQNKVDFVWQAGFAGDDAPRVVFRSIVGRLFAETAINGMFLFPFEMFVSYICVKTLESQLYNFSVDKNV